SSDVCSSDLVVAQVGGVGAVHRPGATMMTHIRAVTCRLRHVVALQREHPRPGESRFMNTDHRCLPAGPRWARARCGSGQSSGSSPVAPSVKTWKFFRAALFRQFFPEGKPAADRMPL